MISTSIEPWIFALLTIMVYSYLIKETVLYRFAEHTIIALSAAYVVVTMIKNLFSLAFVPLSQGKYIYIIPIVLGFLLYSTYFERYRFLNTWGIAFVVGVGIGLKMKGIISAELIRQVQATIVPLNSLNNIIVIICVFSTMSYFIFTREHKGALGTFSRVGRLAMMISFGSAYGYAVMTRINVVINIISRLLFEWLGFG